MAISLPRSQNNSGFCVGVPTSSSTLDLHRRCLLLQSGHGVDVANGSVADSRDADFSGSSYLSGKSALPVSAVCERVAIERDSDATDEW
jgi:hypothetical protein